MTTRTYSLTEIRLAVLFESSSGTVTTQPMEEQWYWPKVQRLVNLGRNGLAALAWFDELYKELG